MPIVQIRQEDIANGKRYHTERCPFSLALKRHTNRKIEVFGDYLVSDGSRFKISKNATEWLEDFDFGRPVQPTYFSFKWE